MPNIIAVKPGDLITSSFINQLVGYLQELEGRVENLEKKGNTVRIDSIAPPEIITEGDVVTIRGVNFGEEAARDVTVGGKRIEQFKDFGTSELIQFDMPHLDNIGTGVATVAFVVRNKQGDGDTLNRSVRNLVPRAQGTGSVLYTREVSSGPNVAVGDSIELPFRVSVSANRDSNYVLSASSSTVPVTFDPPDPFALPADDHRSATPGRDVTARFTVPTGGTTLRISAKENRSDSLIPFTPAEEVVISIGKPIPNSSGAQLLLSRVQGQQATGSKILYASNAISLAVGFELKLTKAGVYTVSLDVTPDGAWDLFQSQDLAVTVPANSEVTIRPRATWRPHAALPSSGQLTVSLANGGSVVGTYSFEMGTDPNA